MFSFFNKGKGHISTLNKTTQHWQGILFCLKELPANCVDTETFHLYS